MLTREDLVADLNDQLMARVVKPLAGLIGIRGAFLQDGVRGNHLPRDQVFADAEVLKRTLRLRISEFVSSDIHFAETIAFFSNVGHLVFLLQEPHRGSEPKNAGPGALFRRRWRIAEVPTIARAFLFQESDFSSSSMSYSSARGVPL
jgi:hypothetical protein